MLLNGIAPLMNTLRIYTYHSRITAPSSHFISDIIYRWQTRAETGAPIFRSPSHSFRSICTNWCWENTLRAVAYIRYNTIILQRPKTLASAYGRVRMSLRRLSSSMISSLLAIFSLEESVRISFVVNFSVLAVDGKSFIRCSFIFDIKLCARKYEISHSLVMHYALPALLSRMPHKKEDVK